MSDLVSRSSLLARYDRIHVGAPGGARKLIAEEPAVDAVPVDKMELHQFSIDTRTRTAKAVFQFGDKRITLCRDCGELAPVVHGRWESAEAKPRLIYFCSVCGEKWGYGSISYMKYCPNCGAKMDGKDGGQR